MRQQQKFVHRHKLDIQQGVHVLKALGYRWNGEGIGDPRAWYLLVGRIDANDRFSNRCWPAETRHQIAMPTL